jgi:hypothetical protein
MSNENNDFEDIMAQYKRGAWAKAKAETKSIPMNKSARPERETPININDIKAIQEWNTKYNYIEQYLEIMKG